MFPIFNVFPMLDERLNIPPEYGWRGKKHLFIGNDEEMSFQLASNSWMSSKMTSWNSTTFLLAIASNVEPWNRFFFDILILRTSLSSRFRVYCSLWNCSSCRWPRRKIFFLRLDPLSAWNSCNNHDQQTTTDHYLWQNLSHSKCLTLHSQKCAWDFSSHMKHKNKLTM